jgi:hypothetical protein
MTTKQNPANMIFGLAAVLAICVCCLAIFAIFSSSDKQPTSNQPIIILPTFDFPNAPADRISVIEYKVFGIGQVSITYQNSTGNPEQLDTYLPWSYPRFYAKTGQFLYVSAQIQSIGDVTCTIFLNGTKYKTSTSKGQYVICTASTSAP